MIWSITHTAAAYGLLKKRSRLFSLNGNNAVLEFFLEGVPDVVERHLDSKKVECVSKDRMHKVVSFPRKRKIGSVQEVWRILQHAERVLLLHMRNI